MPYIMDAHVQAFMPSPFFRAVEPSPTEALSYHVTAALLSLGKNFDDLHEQVADNISGFLNACAHASDGILPASNDHENEGSLDDSIRTATIAVALLGFLDAAAAQADFWKSGGRLSLVLRLRKLLSEPFLTAVETAFSTIRNSHVSDRVSKEWRRYLRHYSEIGRPLGAMLLQRSFMHLLVAATSLLVAERSALKGSHVLDLLLSGEGLLRPMTARSGDHDFRSVETYANAVIDQMNYLEASADFIRLGSSSQQKLAFGVKASALVSYFNCSKLNEDAADADVLMTWLEETLADPVHMADEDLASVVLKSIALICRISPSYASNASRLLPRFIVQSGARSSTIDNASKCLATVLQMLSSDAIITTLYTLGNVLSPGSERALTNGAHSDLGLEAAAQIYHGRHSTGSSISLQISGEEETSIVYGNVVQAICGIASVCKDEKISALAQSMLLQKIGKMGTSVDAKIIPAAAALAISGGQLEFKSLLKSYTRICHLAVVESREVLLAAVMKARNYLSSHIRRDSPLYEIYWEHMLDDIISKGDVYQTHHAKESDVEMAARELAQLLQPLALLMSTNDLASDATTDDDTHAMIRDAWFNLVVHGFTPSTARGKRYMNELRIMAIHSPPLVAEKRGEQVESDIELNTVLRRGMSSDREAMQKKHLTELISQKASEIRGLSYRKVIFLQAAYLVESLRADAGDCTRALSYFLEPSMRRGEFSTIMEGIALAVVERYLKKTLAGTDATFSAQYAATQLAAIFCGCCHRIERVQQAAYMCADRIIRDVPSALCHKSSLFALLELLSLMWSSCLEAETDLYEPRSCFKSVRGRVTVELSDDYAMRRFTLNMLYKKAKTWVSGVVSLAPADVKGLLQTYLSEWDDEGAYGHVSLGRSFALELGFSIPPTDQRLTSLDKLGDCHINTASDFIAQYTTRQEYRYAEPLPDHSLEWLSFMRLDRRASFLPNSDTESTDAVTALAHIENRLRLRKTTPIGDVRDILRRAASLLCRSDGDECAIAHYLVSIPFAMFTKESIKLGVSLWLGVMNENPRSEPRIFNEIAQQWEFSIQKRLGLFSTTMTNPDPFFQKEEFAPSDSEALAKRKQHVHNLLSPHSRLLQFFQSHVNATRLGALDTQKGFLRFLDVTLDALKTATPHPMARELRFQIVLFGLRVLRNSTTIGAIAQWRLKKKVLTAALSWFNGAPKWSFGSNILQLKTELRLLSDVIAAVKAVAYIGAHQIGNMKSLQAREQLLLLLLESEHARLSVWVYPLTEPSRSQIQSMHHAKGSLEVSSTILWRSFGVSEHVLNCFIQNAVIPLVRTAWAESPALAVELTTRFQHPRILKDVRWLLLNAPARAASYPDALDVLLDGGLPGDVSFQLKVNPFGVVSFSYVLIAVSISCSGRLSTHSQR
jgi:phosphatidylinositol 4-kinase A